MSKDLILLAHGSGGRLSHDLVERLFLKHFGNPVLLQLDDSAVVDLPASQDDPRRFVASPPRIAFSTDSYVVSPLVFPGG
ncbi:MAG: hydrogenase expression/formation protein HypE, partial [Anaerolineae bacterium]